MTSRRARILSTALLATSLAAVSGVAVGDSTASYLKTQKYSESFKSDLIILGPDGVKPFGKAKAELAFNGIYGNTGTVGYDSTVVTLKVKDVDRSVAGRTFGVHLHVGPCKAGNGAAAGMHYNVDMMNGLPMNVSPRTEIWLDSTVGEDGKAESATTVKWRPLAGERSVVFHSLPTADSGAAGDRLACIPVVLKGK